MEIREILAFNLRRLRHAQSLSQEELAHRAHIDRTYISALERSIYAAGIDVVDRLASVLGVAAADLLQPPLPAHGEVKEEPRRTDATPRGRRSKREKPPTR